MSTAKEFLQRFSTKKDAITSVDLLIHELETYAPYDAIQDRIVDLFKLRKEIELFQDKDLAEQVLEFMNLQFGTQYRNAEKIKAVIRQIPKASFDQFASIIMHKKETWGKDPKMQEFLRPATLFGSSNKFKTYLDDATNHWIKKEKHDYERKI